MKFVILVYIFLLIGCERKPDLMINGKPYRIRHECVHYKTENTFHYGLSYRGKFEYHYGPETKCDSIRIDTVLITKKNKF